MITIKVICGCGQKYAFDAEPVDGRMPQPVKCPVCGADGTAAANEIIARTLPAQKAYAHVTAVHRYVPSATNPASAIAPGTPVRTSKAALWIGLSAGGIVLAAVVAGLIWWLRPSAQNPLSAEINIKAQKVGYADFPADLRQVLDQRVESIKKSGGVCLAGRIAFADGTTITGGNDVMINYTRGFDVPLTVYSNGWFIARSLLPDVSQQRGNTEKGNLALRAFTYYPVNLPVELPTNEITYVAVRMNRTPANNLSTIQGSINDENGSPIGGASVSLRFPFAYSGQSPSKTVTTSPDGKFSFSKLPPTAFWLYASAKGTAGENDNFSTSSGDVLDTNLTLYPVKEIVFDYVCQTNGTCDFATGPLLQGTLTWRIGVGGLNFAQPKFGGYPSDLNLDQIHNDLNFRCFYGGANANGFYDAGAVDFSSVTAAAESGYAMRSLPCQVGHVYVVKTYDGYFAKLIVKSADTSPTDGKKSTPVRPAAGTNLQQQLKDLKALFDQGKIDQSTYEQRKAKILKLL